MSKYNWSKQRILEIINKCDSYSDCLRLLNIPIAGNNISTLRKKIDEYNIDISHFTFGNKKKSNIGYVNASYYLRKKSSIKSSKLRIKLIKEGYKENKCECCGIRYWNGKELVMQLHHIDGDNTNNELSNLQMLCPNCHSLTENYCGLSNKFKYYCEICGKEKKTKNSKYCLECASIIRRKVERPNKENLLYDYKELRNLTDIGKKYNVTSNTIVKWLKSFNLPYKINELNEIIDI